MAIKKIQKNKIDQIKMRVKITFFDETPVRIRGIVMNGPLQKPTDDIMKFMTLSGVKSLTLTTLNPTDIVKYKSWLKTSQKMFVIDKEENV